MSISEAENNFSYGRRLLAEAPVNEVAEAWQNLQSNIDLSELIEELRSRLTFLRDEALPGMLRTSQVVRENSEQALAAFSTEEVSRILVGNSPVSIRENIGFMGGRAIMDGVLADSMRVNLEGAIGSLNFLDHHLSHYDRSQAQGLRAAEDNIGSRDISVQQADIHIQQIGK